MTVDNSKLVAPFCPPVADGDSFVYTEMLDRGQKKGNNGQRLVKSFYHRSVDEFWEQWPSIMKLCDLAKVRACTRLAPRSAKKVAKECARKTLQCVLDENWWGVKSQFNSACGLVSPNEKLWLFDVDAIDERTEKFHQLLVEAGHLRARIPSKKGEHLIATPFDTREWVGKRADGWTTWGEISLHRDNPTNLYIPDGAD